MVATSIVVLILSIAGYILKGPISLGITVAALIILAITYNKHPKAITYISTALIGLSICAELLGMTFLKTII